ncbi:hypothetical protein D3C76_1037540 [compost metagenome]
MQQPKAQTRFGQAHALDAKHLERGQHDGQATGQRAQSVWLQACQLQAAHMPGSQQAKRQTQQPRIGDTACAVIIQAIGLQNFGQHPGGAGRANGCMPVMLANLSGDARELQARRLLCHLHRRDTDFAAGEVSFGESTATDCQALQVNRCLPAPDNQLGGPTTDVHHQAGGFLARHAVCDPGIDHVRLFLTAEDGNGETQALFGTGNER